MKQLIAASILVTCFLFEVPTQAQNQPFDSTAIDIHPDSADELSSRRTINFFIISKRKKGSLDLASRFNVFRSKLKNFFRRKKFVALVARNTDHMSRKVQRKLSKYHGKIGTLWFDSHGMYKKGYSLFMIGADEISYISMKDSVITKPFKSLIPYTDSRTSVIIGSCYGGATYNRSSIDYKDTTRMNGDSLMKALGTIFPSATIYGSESWVMTKPGLFLKRAAVAGFPGRKLFLDVCYRPVWERVGKWNEYRASSDTIRAINPVTMDMYGNLIVRGLPYPYKPDDHKDIRRNLRKLKPNLYK